MAETNDESLPNLPNLSGLPAGGPAPAKRARSESETQASDAPEYLFGFYREVEGEGLVFAYAQVPLNEYGELDSRLPTRTDVLAQLSGENSEFNFEKNHCDYGGAIENFTEKVMKLGAFAVVAKPNKEIIGMISVDNPFLLNTLGEKLRDRWTDIYKEIREDTPLSHQADAAKDTNATFGIHYACTAGSPHTDSKMRGVMRYLLYCWSRLIDTMFVQPLATELFYDTWGVDIRSRQRALKLIRRMCFFTLYSVESALERWEALGFEPLYGSSRNLFKPVYTPEGTIPVAPSPRVADE